MRSLGALPPALARLPRDIFGTKATMTTALKQRLRDFAVEAGFAGMGVCRPDAIPQAAPRLAAFVADGMHGQMGWMAERTSRGRSGGGSSKQMY